MDVQSLTYKHANIRSDNECALNCQPTSEHNNEYVGGPDIVLRNSDSNDASQWSKQHPPSMVSTTPGSLPSAEPTPMCTRTRIIRPPKQFRNDVTFSAQAWDDLWEVHDFEIQQDLQDPIAFTATSNPDTMYYSDALKAPD